MERKPSTAAAVERQGGSDERRAHGEQAETPPELAEDFRAIADYTYDWETWMDPKGKPLWINPAVERMTGYSVADCMAMPDYPLPLIAEEDRSTIVALLDEAKQGTSGNDVTFRILRKNRTVAWAAVSWQPILNKAGRSLGIRTSVRDITERKKVEEILRAAHEKAMRANMAKSRFLAAASHDLRQPLQAMEYLLTSLRFTATDPESQRLIKDLGACLGATNELLGSMLEISRLDAGTLLPRVAEFEIGMLIDEVSLEFASLANDKGLELRSVACSAVVRSDPTHMRRILMNLVSNAVRYTHEGRVLVGCRRRAGRLSVEVWDTGEGFSADQTERIFEEFYQIGNPERDRSHGLGLGLSIVRRMAEQLGHPVVVRSVPDRGSLFAIEVPLVEGAAGPAVEAEPGYPDLLSRKTILVIEDERSQLQAIGQLLPHWGCRAVLAMSLQDAVAKLRDAAAPPDLIISDYRLRDGVDGAQVIRQLRSELCPGTPGIILTGDTELSRLVAAQESGFKVVHKPINSDELRLTMEAAIRTARAAESAAVAPGQGGAPR